MCSLYLSVAEKKPRAKNQHGPKTPRPPLQREMLLAEWSTPGKKAGGCVRALLYCTPDACNVSTVLIDLNNLNALNRLNKCCLLAHRFTRGSSPFRLLLEDKPRYPTTSSYTNSSHAFPYCAGAAAQPNIPL